MRIKSLSIGRLTLKNNVLVAPLAGFSDSVFRSTCYRLGAGLCFTEMVSAKGLIFGGDATKKLLLTTDDEYIKAVQIFGDDPEIILKAALTVPEMAAFDIIDVNMGCPVPKVFGNGEGSALLEKPDLAEKIVKALERTGKVVTVKMRLGVEKGKPVAVELGKRLVGAGAKMITLHARYRSEYYSGTPYFDECAKLKAAVEVPVIFNGGIMTKEDADEAIKLSGADGVMLARGALQAPWLIAEILGKPVPDKNGLVIGHYLRLCDLMGEKQASINFRKQAALYLKGVRGGKKLKEKFFSATTKKEYLEVFENADFD